jgi:hypothetical protein
VRPPSCVEEWVSEPSAARKVLLRSPLELTVVEEGTEAPLSEPHHQRSAAEPGKSPAPPALPPPPPPRKLRVLRSPRPSHLAPLRPQVKLIRGPQPRRGNRWREGGGCTEAHCCVVGRNTQSGGIWNFLRYLLWASPVLLRKSAGRGGGNRSARSGLYGCLTGFRYGIQPPFVLGGKMAELYF